MVYLAIGITALFILLLITIFSKNNDKEKNPILLESAETDDENINEYIDDAVYERKILMD